MIDSSHDESLKLIKMFGQTGGVESVRLKDESEREGKKEKTKRGRSSGVYHHHQPRADDEHNCQRDNLRKPKCIQSSIVRMRLVQFTSP